MHSEHEEQRAVEQAVQMLRAGFHPSAAMFGVRERKDLGVLIV